MLILLLYMMEVIEEFLKILKLDMEHVQLMQELKQKPVQLLDVLFVKVLKLN